MSVFVKSLQSRLILFHAHRFLVANQARQAHWLPDYKPGPYPDTPEKRAAAAKKYNLLPEEYEPYGLDEDCIGDYPKLPLESVDSKDPYYPWDDPELRKNYNDPVNRQISMLLPMGVSTAPEKLSKTSRALQFLAVFFTGLGIIITLRQFKFNFPVCEKQFPTPGVTHYLFELGEEDPDLIRRRKMEACMKEAGLTDYNPIQTAS